MGKTYERANTDRKKKEICNRLYAAWLKYPQLRLGQLIENARDLGVQLFYEEDYDLIKDIEKFCEEE